MDASSQAPKLEATRPLRRPPKRLVFDRRYGWVYDEWRDPLEVALSGFALYPSKVKSFTFECCLTIDECGNRLCSEKSEKPQSVFSRVNTCKSEFSVPETYAIRTKPSFKM
ncbi:hypothetical protein J5N97_020140 [Dioscorea zingiberensis]|uniref:Uncharacterized protein n=1 Tax=Dioscorea zingiberensis TaxID=325984 RepID=A0A9D5HCY6_9LILI|nr:hypothetical protein J5N97_020140 [Dioscorea zingiberensis]